MIAARDTDEVRTREIERLATAAGYEVVDVLTQRRREDRTYNLGAGKARELADRAERANADTVLFDGRLTPGQYGDLSGLLPPEVAVIDRYRLVLEIFAEGAGDERARKQVELATLEYRLPRLRQTSDEGALSEATEKGSPVYDVEDRIARLRRELAQIERRDARRRESRREEGFDLVAIAGYTNAGKSTLLHRLADESSVESSSGPADETQTAATADRLFETLETTTRRATLEGRRTLVTDTVGLIDDLPHELVDAFSATLGEVADSDCVVAVLDASAPAERFERRARVTFETLAADADRVIPVCNKVDLLDDETLAARRETVRAIAPDAPEAVACSATEGTGLAQLRERIVSALPGERATFRLPNDGRTQEFLSWCHDRGRTDVTYEGSEVRVAFAANPRTVAAARRRVDALGE